MTEPYQIHFPKSVTLLLHQTNIYATVQLLTRVYTWPVFIITVYGNWKTDVSHFQLPLSLLCLYIEIEHHFHDVSSSETPFYSCLQSCDEHIHYHIRFLMRREQDHTLSDLLDSWWIHLFLIFWYKSGYLITYNIV